MKNECIIDKSWWNETSCKCEWYTCWEQLSSVLSEDNKSLLKEFDEILDFLWVDKIKKIRIIQRFTNLNTEFRIILINKIKSLTENKENVTENTILELIRLTRLDQEYDWFELEEKFHCNILIKEWEEFQIAVWYTRRKIETILYLHKWKKNWNLWKWLFA